jgi:hypothetical protein
VNGDGLTDYMFSERNQNNMAECLMLNNGQGWNVVFRCRASYNSNTGVTTFYGDCAL